MCPLKDLDGKKHRCNCYFQHTASALMQMCKTQQAELESDASALACGAAFGERAYRRHADSGLDWRDGERCLFQLSTAFYVLINSIIIIKYIGN